METSELWQLELFRREFIDPLLVAINKLRENLEHNATQSDKRPVEDRVDEVQSLLGEVPIAGLTYSQRDWLDRMGILNYLGAPGVRIISDIIFTSNFDPRTAADRVQSVHGQLNRANKQMKTLGEALGAFEWVQEHPLMYRDGVEIRVNFKDEAGITNTADLRKQSSEWYEIIRGVTNAVDERPEDVEIRGVSNGSVIIWLAGSVLVTALLAKIVKNVSGMALDGLQVLSTIEDLRAKKLLNEDIRKSLQEGREKRVAEQKEKLLDELLNQTPHKLTPEKRAWLEKSLTNLLKFFDSGGDMDFLEPPKEEYIELGDAEEGPEDELRETLQQIRENKTKVLLLTSEMEVEP